MIRLDPEGIGEAEHGRSAEGKRLQGGEKQPGQRADRAANQQLHDDETRQTDRVLIVRGRLHAIEQQRGQRQGCADDDKQPDLRRNLRVADAGRDHQASADTAEQQEGRDDGM